MACLLVPAAEAVITTIAARAVKAKEIRSDADISFSCASDAREGKISFSTKLGWLNKMLWGGSALLALEHIWHGEIIPYFPFLTAIKTGETAEMLAEMGSVGVAMSVLVTVAWGGMVAVAVMIEKRAAHDSKPVREGAQS